MENVIINKKDNVGVCLDGTEKIPAGHKYALREIKTGEYVVKYGEIIGRATSDIQEGEWVHTHNVRSHLDENVAYRYEFNADTVEKSTATFKGYKRAYGRAGIRNEIYIIPTVGCVNNVCLRLQKEAQKLVRGSIDGIFALTHQFGCSQLGADNENIKKLLCSIALNPNASYVLFVGLGCENNGMDGIKETLAPYGRDNIEYFNCQEVEDEHAYGMKILEKFAEKASKLEREDVDFSELCIGLKCGGRRVFGFDCKSARW
jgi:altronate hydrolase